MSQLKGSAELIEARRYQALRSLDEGFSLNQIGCMLRAALSSVMRWRDAAKSGGGEALQMRFSPGGRRH